MSGGGGTTQQVNRVPQYIEDQHQDVLNAGNTVATRPYQTFPGPRIAGWTPDQTQAITAIREQTGAWRPAIDDARNAAGSVAGTITPSVTQVLGRPTQRFDAQSYLSANPDVMTWARETAAGTGQSIADLASQHWNQYGMGEGRSGAMQAIEYPTMQAAQIGSAAQMQAASMNRGNIRDVTAGKFTDADLSAYMNPFTQNVISTTLSDLSRQNDQVNNATRARLAAAGAFGGSRGQIAETENNRNYLDTVARTSAQLNSQNFTQAQNTIGQDQNRALTAGGMNQSMDWNVTQGNATFQQQANAANAAAENARLARNAELEQAARAANMGAQVNLSQFDGGQAFQAAMQGNQQRLGAAQLLGNLGQLTQGLGGNDASALMGIGREQQSLNQANLDLAYQDFLRQQGYPAEMLNLRQGLLSGPFTTTQTGSTSTDNTGQIVGSGLMAAGTVAAAFM